MAWSPDGRIATLAIGLAITAVIVVTASAIVVASRPRPTLPTSAPAVPAAPAELTIHAHAVVRIDRDTLELASDARGPIGITIKDTELRGQLQLASTDVITAISGRQIRRQFDLYDALLGASMMNATALYVELLRDGQPLLIKWKLEGDLRATRAATTKQLQVPPVALAPDPLTDTIHRLSPTSFELPRATLDQLAANVTSGASIDVRIIDGVLNGQLQGLRLYRISTTSVWAALGLANGDLITSVNGRPISKATLSLDFEFVRTQPALELAITRRGAPIVQRYAIK
jgi:S1-C subfamily serine protease